MSEMGFYSLPTVKLNKKSKASRLTNFPTSYVGNFYRNLVDNVDNVLGSDFYGRIASDYNIPTEDVQKYILATCEFAKGMQNDINHYVTRDRINTASFRRKLYSVSKNILRQQNPLELLFENISTFDAENLIAGSLLRERDVGKKVLASDLMKNAPAPPGKDYATQNRLNRLRDVQEPTNNNNNNNIFPLPSPPALPLGPRPFIPPLPPFQPSPSVFNSFQPPAPESNNSFGNFHIPAHLSSTNFGNRDQGLSGHIFGSQTQTLLREKEKEKVVQHSVQKDTIYKLVDPSRLELGDGLLNSLGVETDDILEQKYRNKKQKKDADLEQIKEDYNFDEIRDAFDEGVVPHQLDFFFGGEKCNFN